MINIEILLALLWCHWAGDYTHLSRPYMLAAKKFGTPVLPILHHALVHGVLMAIAVGFLTKRVDLVLLAFTIQASTHFFIDVWKGRMNAWFPSLQNPAKYPHWYVFGFDQMCHIVVIVFITKLLS